MIEEIFTKLNKKFRTRLFRPNIKELQELLSEKRGREWLTVYLQSVKINMEKLTEKTSMTPIAPNSRRKPSTPTSPPPNAPRTPNTTNTINYNKLTNILINTEGIQKTYFAERELEKRAKQLLPKRGTVNGPKIPVVPIKKVNQNIK